jgi:DNA-binding beta-propeller fold protein YncE
VSKLSPVLKIFAFLPPLLLLVGTAGIVSCGKSLFSTVTPTSTSSSSATATPGSMAFVSNFNSGKISEFTRKTTTGKLKLVNTVAAGSKQGPKGMAITPSNSYLYATNFKDGTILGYSIGSGAVLTSVGSFSDGSSNGPEQIAISPNGSYLWATNLGNGSNGTISAWSIDSTNGMLTSVQTVTGLAGPFGLVVNSAGTILYVADNTAGLIYTFTITSTGALSQNGSAVASLGTANGSPGLMTIDPTGSYLYVDDLTSGVVSLFNITTGTPTFGAIYPNTFSTSQPVGIAIAELSSANYVLTANQTTGNTWAFQILNNGVLNVPPLSAGSVSQPTGLAVDPQNAFAYTADQGDGMVGIFQFNIACPTVIQTVCQIGTVATETNPPSDGSAPFDVVLTN